MCLTSCNDLSFLGVKSVIECSAVSTCEGTPERPTHATCGDQGCVCDEVLPPLSQLNPADYMSVVTCTSSMVEFRANKCVLNKAGFYLDDLYVNGVERAETEADLVSGCRGQLIYDNGPQYVFVVNRNQSECMATVSQGADGQQWWRNGLQGFVALERDDDGEVTKKRQTVIKFGCPVQN